MKKQLALVISTLLLIPSATLPTAASQDEAPVKGEVVQVQERGSGGNGNCRGYGGGSRSSGAGGSGGSRGGGGGCPLAA